MLHGGVMWHSQVMWLFPHDMYVITSHTVPSSFSDTVMMYMLVYLWPAAESTACATAAHTRASSGSLCGNGHHHHHHHHVTWLHSCVQHHGIRICTLLWFCCVTFRDTERGGNRYNHLNISLIVGTIVCFTDTDPVHWLILKFLRTS